MMIHGFFLMAEYLNDGKKCIDETAKALRDAFESAPQNISSARD